MKKKKKSKIISLSAKNFKRFFHYHDGGGREQAIKIGASFLACFSLLIIAGAVQIEKVFAERSYFLSMLVPELAEPAFADEGNAVLLAMEDTDAMTSQKEVTSSAPIEQSNAPPPKSAPTPEPSTATTLQENQSSKPPPDKPEENSGPGPNEEWERQNAINDRNNVLREMRDQKRELRRTCAQLKRLKNAAVDLAACNDLAAKVVEWEGKLKSWNGTDSQELRDLMDDYRELQIWEELEMMRLKANLPQELNRFFRDLLRVERLLKQKSFQRIVGLNWPTINAKFGEIKAFHAEAKVCYEAGDLQCSSEKLNEARESNYPGELEGSLQMLRGINDMLKQVKNSDVKTEVQAMLQSAIDLINAGEWRDGRQEIESYHNEVNLFLQYILRGQQRSKSGPNDTLQRLEKLINKYEGGSGANNNPLGAD